jgi:hypothetical protein
MIIARWADYCPMGHHVNPCPSSSPPHGFGIPHLVSPFIGIGPVSEIYRVIVYTWEQDIMNQMIR